ncbi:FG-GAP repeat domain-containing protein [Aspergillus melleus]|uniref:FG-GAP repeat domain-containing protein n=1 Tax=Aspergillus melleus TaxID=138277 RepID=UPI001E8D531F|nr:uncharacterized protein LDX57_008522 [Aspergillus melleus]KAH8430858.1 hypothetical protein LDX57_008522 [Aspergillus melleus]
MLIDQGDGLDDFVCIGPDGTAYASLNLGNGNDEIAPTFCDITKIKDPEGYDRDHVRLGDIDGDGRTDYCVIHDDGDIHCWRNMGGASRSTLSQGIPCLKTSSF